MKKHIFYIIFGLLIALQQNFVQAQTIVFDDIEENTTWTHSGSPYYISAEVTVIKDVKLTIEPGVEIFFTDYTNFLVVKGEIEAIGTSADNIRFFGFESVKSNQYGTLIVSEGKATLEYVIFDRLGPVAVAPHAELLAQVFFANGSNVTVKNSTLKNSTGHGFFIESGTVFNGHNNTFVHLGDPYFCPYFVTPDITKTISISGNNYLEAESAAIKIYGEIKNDTITWDIKEVPYRILNVEVLGGGVLNILPGVKIQIGRIFNSTDEVLNASYGGVINMIGTSTNPICVTGGMYNGDTGGKIEVKYPSNNSISHFSHCIFSNMGTGIEASTNNKGDTVFTVNYSCFDGMFVNAIRVVNCLPVIKNNSFSNIGHYAIRNNGTLIIDARNNYWGHPSGPTHSSNLGGMGQMVGDLVLFDPFLTTSPVDCGLSTSNPGSPLASMDMQYKVFPNPVISGSTLHIEKIAPSQILSGSNINVKLFDSFGRIVYTNRLKGVSGNWEIAAPNKTGVYYLQLSNGEYFHTVKVVVN